MVSTAHSYAALQRRLEGISVGVMKRTPGFCGYSDSDVASRLMQRYAELSVFEFTRLAADKYRKTGALPADAEEVTCGGLLFDADRKVTLSPRKFMALLFGYAAYWGYALLVILASLNLSGTRRQVSLLYGVGLQDLQAEGDDARFLNFCRAGQIQPLFEADFLVVQAGKRVNTTEPSRVKYSRVPLFLALRWSGLEPRPWLLALGRHLWAAASFLRAVCVFPALMLLGRDAASHAVAVALNRDGRLKDVILTNSNYFSQPLWFWALPHRAYGSHIVWYSQNNYPISYVDEETAVPIPNLRHVQADVQWVWSEGFKDFLQDICPQCSYRVVGPVVWHLPTEEKGATSGCLKIVLFDVTPISQKTELKLGLLRNFYTEKIISRFILDVVEAVQIVGQRKGTKIEVVLKHKRGHANIHSSEYIETISKLTNAGAITLVAPASNLYDLINESSQVIAIPYSSPVYIGREVGKDAIWYDPTETLHWKLGTPEISLVQGREQLIVRLMKTLA